MAQWVKNPTSIREHAGSALALLSRLRIWCCHNLQHRLQIRLGSGIAVAAASTCSSDFFFCFVFLRPNPRHMEVPRLGVELELQPLAYSIATAMWDPSASVTYTTAHGNNGSLTH